MDLVDGFLVFTIISYYVSCAVPKPVTKNIKPRWIERTVMMVLGSVLLANLLLNIPYVWLVYGVFWAVAACLSYLGYSKWNVLWRKNCSDMAQITMFLWDSLISLSCLLKF
ncbi:MAG: hypothetical protein ACTSSA_11495 [Candidatus Freyarchaeota archaeon]